MSTAACNIAHATGVEINSAEEDQPGSSDLRSRRGAVGWANSVGQIEYRITSMVARSPAVRRVIGAVVGRPAVG